MNLSVIRSYVDSKKATSEIAGIIFLLQNNTSFQMLTMAFVLNQVF